MLDPRVAKLARVLVHYSLGLRPGQRLAILTTPAGEALAQEAFREALLAGGLPDARMTLTHWQEVLYKHGSEEQLKDISPLRRLVAETFDALLFINAPENTRSLTRIDPKVKSIHSRAGAEISELIDRRTAEGTLRWSLTVYPTEALAQEAEMGLHEYQDFVYGAGMLDLDDPVAWWQAEGERQKRAIAWLAGRKQVYLRGPDIDLRLSIEGRPFIESDGKYNFPDGEIFTSPVEDSAEGRVRFAYPVLYGGSQLAGVQLRFEKGRVVEEKAERGQALLSTMLDSDEGARVLGEWGIGTNYNIQRFTGEMLFDEKIGGTIHLAVGSGFPEAGGKNRSGVHWDMLCDMRQGEVEVDGEIIYRDGRLLI